MSLLLPQLEHHAALEIVRRHLDSETGSLGRLMPDLPESVTYSPVGGTQVDNNRESLSELRAELVALATAHGMPGPMMRRAVFEGTAARILHAHLAMTPHEASNDGVWSYVTCAWLLDVAVWRFGADASVKRFTGDVNRNTFRRMWWRAEILGPDIDLTLLGEDELVNIMERPTLASDRRLARATAAQFLTNVDRGARQRQDLMREVSKRLLRLTPFVSFGALDDPQLASAVEEVFEAAAASIEGREPSKPARPPVTIPEPSPNISTLPAMPRRRVADGDLDGGAQETADAGFEAAAACALGIALRTGRVTNTSLRKEIEMDGAQAREVLQRLVAEKRLLSQGVRRGTYYVLSPEESPR